MANIVKELLVRLKGDSKGLESATERAKKALNAMTVAFAAAGAAGTALGLRAIKTADNIGKTADKLGVATSELQEFRFAAEQAGISQQTLDMGLQRFTRRAAEAAQGMGEAREALKTMGVQLTDSQGRLKSTGDLLSQVADAFQRTESDGERLRLAFKLFDSEGVAMVNMLRDGSGALNQMRQEARSLGLVMDESLIRKSEKAQSNLDALGQVIKTNLNAGVLDGFVGDFNNFSEMVKNPEIAQNIRNIGELLGSAAGAALALANATGSFIGKLDRVNKHMERTRQAQKNPSSLNVGVVSPYSEVSNDQITKAIELSKSLEQQTVKYTATATSGTAQVKQEIQEQNEEVRKQSDLWQRVSEDLTEQKERVTELRNEASDMFVDLVDGTTSFRKAAISAISDIARNLLRLSVGGSSSGGIFGTIANTIFGSLGGGGASFGAADFASRALNASAGAYGPGFNTGGSFVVRGKSGTDRNMMSLNGQPIANVSKGEKVSIGRNGQSGEVVVNQTLNITTGVQQTVRAEIARLMPQIQAQTTRAYDEARLRGKTV